jgi:hypothetical protein
MQKFTGPALNHNSLPANGCTRLTIRVDRDETRKPAMVGGFLLVSSDVLNWCLVPKAGLEPARPEGNGF